MESTLVLLRCDYADRLWKNLAKAARMRAMQERVNPLDHPTPWQRLCFTLELPTWLVALVSYGGWLALTWYYQELPGVVTALWAPVLVAWQGSLRHECVHGHPHSFALGSVVGAPPLNLLDPFPLYRKNHLIHHKNANLTYPGLDTESYYQSPELWAQMPAWKQKLLTFNQTFLGRMTVGPLISYAPWFVSEFKKIKNGDHAHLKIWIIHAIWVAILLVWAVVICGVPLLHYLFFFTYLGTSLGMVRSFFEHRYHDDPDGRSTIVEHGAFFHLLFLNNSFHVIHHAKPDLPWYVLKKMFKADPEKYKTLNHGFVQESYPSLMQKHLLTPTYLPPHPKGKAS